VLLFALPEICGNPVLDTLIGKTIEKETK